MSLVVAGAVAMSVSCPLLLSCFGAEFCFELVFCLMVFKITVVVFVDFEAVVVFIIIRLSILP